MEQIERINTDQDQLIKDSLDKLQRYIENENYKGWDPYDALSSPLFKLPFLRSNKLIRFGTQQIVKRSRINLRPLLRVPKGYNPVTLGLVLQGYCYLMKNEQSASANRLKIKRDTSPFDTPDESGQVAQDDTSTGSVQAKLSVTEEKIEFLVDELERLQSIGYSGSCWGYDFDWEARHANIPAFKPTVVATGFITNALFLCYTITGNEKAKKMLVSATDFILNDLNRSYPKLPPAANFQPATSFCFSYSPFDKQMVFNASMKGVRLLAQVYSITKDKALIETARNAVEFVVQNQNEDGSWYYSLAESGKFIDNYHTGYVLDCLDEYRLHTGDNSYDSRIQKGFEFYKNNFFEADGCPKFYHSKKYPTDCTAAAQSILTLVRFGQEKTARQIAEYMISNMMDESGYFYFRDYGTKIEKTSFMRWSNAWMFAGLTFLSREVGR